MAGTRASEVDETTILRPVSDEPALSRRELRRRARRSQVRRRRHTRSNDAGSALLSRRALRRRERDFARRCFLLMLAVSLLFVVGVGVMLLFAHGEVVRVVILSLALVCAAVAPIPSFRYWRRLCV